MRRCLYAILLAVGGIALTSVTAARQLPTFKAGVDLVAVDVQVIDHDGHPLQGLTPADFEVSIGGQKRKVVSADFVRAEMTPDAAAIAPGPASQPPSGRDVFVAIDGLSFDMADSRGVADASRAFVDRLPPSDRVGLFVYPLGPKVDPTTDHAAVTGAMAKVMGQRDPQGGQFTFTPSEIVDITAGDSDAYQRSVLRNCGIQLAPNAVGMQPGSLAVPLSAETCPAQMLSELAVKALQAEGQLQTSLGIFGSFLRGLGAIPGRKIVVLVSAGDLMTDRQGGRPDAGMLPTALGRQAAEANVTIYTLFIDQTMLEQGTAENRHGLGGAINGGRDAQLMSRWLDMFSGAAGGTMLTDLVGSGTVPFDRILLETSAYYVLGVQPEDRERDGQIHALAIKTSRHGVTVRGRAWVRIPPPGAAGRLTAATSTPLPTPAAGAAPASPAAVPPRVTPSAGASTAARTPTISPKLQAWREAVRTHVPGRMDASVALVASWSRADLNDALLPLEARHAVGGMSQAEQNYTLEAGAILHADIAILHRIAAGYALPADGRRLTLIKDGRAVGNAAGTFHWEIGRQLLDAVQPRPQEDDHVRLWYRATSAFLQDSNDDAELTDQLFRARQLFPRDPIFLLYAGTMEEGYVTPRPHEAEILFEAALHADSTLDEARVRLAHVLGEQGEHQQAVDEVTRALRDALPEALAYDAFVILAREEEAVGDRSRAEQAAEDATALYPGAESARLILSQVASDGGDRVAALHALDLLRTPSRARSGPDPWNVYYRAHDPAAATLLAELRQLAAP